MAMEDSTILVPAADESLGAPSWVGRMLGSKSVAYDAQKRQGITLSIVESLRASLVTARVPGAASLSRQEFQQATMEAYVQIRTALDRCSATYPVRIWNHIPAIRRVHGHGMDQYMAFNAGRYAAFAAWYGDVRWAERSVPAASAVGHRGQDLVIHVLAALRPGRPVENPRQVSAYHYSQRYGPKPPCFARATVIEPLPGVRRVLVAGTASVVGEDSRHDDLSAQVRETLVNLLELLQAADVRGGLSQFTDLRIYYVRPDDLPTLHHLAARAFATSSRIEWLQADLCRAELLVEIEGVTGE